MEDIYSIIDCFIDRLQGLQYSKRLSGVLSGEAASYPILKGCAIGLLKHFACTIVQFRQA